MLRVFRVHECTVMLTDKELEAEVIRFYSSIVSNADGIVHFDGGCKDCIQ